MSIGVEAQVRERSTRASPNIKMQVAIVNSTLDQGHVERGRWHEPRTYRRGCSGMKLRGNDVRPVENGRELLERIKPWQSGKTQLHKVGTFVGRPVITLRRVSNDLIV